MRNIAIVILGLLVSGCGRNLPEMASVSGRVQFNGGPPPAAGIVSFTPLEAGDGLPRRPGSGRFGSDGYFKATSFNKSEGLVPGRYWVRIECLAYEPSTAPGDYEKANYVPASYRPPELEIKPGQENMDDLLYDVPLKK